MERKKKKKKARTGGDGGLDLSGKISARWWLSTSFEDLKLAGTTLESEAAAEVGIDASTCVEFNRRRRSPTRQWLR